MSSMTLGISTEMRITKKVIRLVKPKKAGKKKKKKAKAGEAAVTSR